MLSLLREVNDEVEGVEAPLKADAPEAGPASPDGWSVGHLSQHGMILSCDGFQLKLSIDELHKFFDIAEDGTPGEIRDQNSDIVLVEPTSDSIVLTRTGDQVYPNGVSLDLDTLKEMGVEQEDSEEEPEENDTIEQQTDEAVKMAFRRSGGKIKRGFRVTSGIRKGRVVANMKTAFKPRAKASTRMKLKIAGRKKKIVRILKSKRTRKKSQSKRLHRMNSR